MPNAEMPDIDLSAIQEAMASACHGAPSLAGHSVLRLMDLTPDEFDLVLDTAAWQKADWNAGIHAAPGAGKAAALILEESDIIARGSLEVAIARMGAYPLVMKDGKALFANEETLQDAVLALGRYADCLALSGLEQSLLEEVADWSEVPVVNAGNEDFDICQGLADALTIRECKGSLEGLNVAYVGAGCDALASTYLELGALAGMNVAIACEADAAPYEECLEECQELAKETGAELLVFTEAADALASADVVVGDVSVADMAMAKPDAIFLHALPAERGAKVSDDVMDSDQSVVYDQAENRLHAEKALLSLLMGVV